MISCLLTLRGCFSTTKDLTARINIPVPDKTNSTPIAIQALKIEGNKKHLGINDNDGVNSC